MTDHPLADHLPPGAVIITPAYDQDLEIGFGYAAETSRDVVYLTIRDPQKGPHVVLLTPEMARQVADTLTTRCTNLARLRTNQNGQEIHASTQTQRRRRHVLPLQQFIDMELVWPHPLSWTSDHLHQLMDGGHNHGTLVPSHWRWNLARRYAKPPPHTVPKSTGVWIRFRGEFFGKAEVCRSSGSAGAVPRGPGLSALSSGIVRDSLPSSARRA